MKKILGVAAIILFFFVLLALLVFKLLPSSSKKPATAQSTVSFPTQQEIEQTLPSDSSPEHIAQQCYAWYVRYYAATNAWSYAAVASHPVMQRCFSSALIQSWHDTFDVSETDPVLISSDYYETWLSSVTARTVSQLSGSSDVEVTLGTGVQAQTIAVQLSRSGSMWQIAQVTLTKQAGSDQ